MSCSTLTRKPKQSLPTPAALLFCKHRNPPPRSRNPQPLSSPACACCWPRPIFDWTCAVWRRFGGSALPRHHWPSSATSASSDMFADDLCNIVTVSVKRLASADATLITAPTKRRAALSWVPTRLRTSKHFSSHASVLDTQFCGHLWSIAILHLTAYTMCISQNATQRSDTEADESEVALDMGVPDPACHVCARRVGVQPKSPTRP